MNLTILRTAAFCAAIGSSPMGGIVLALRGPAPDLAEWKERMDNAVALVQAYLRINGYFTVSEYPVILPVAVGGYRTATDLDVLAFRFPGSGHVPPEEEFPGSSAPDIPDPALGVGIDHPDMLIGEVKEGRAELNGAATDPEVLRAVLTRFGCCPADAVGAAVERLQHRGRARLPGGHEVRLAAFGSSLDGGDKGGQRWRDHTPVLVDDIISTARTMIETVRQRRQLGLGSPVCLAVHPVFAPGAYEELVEAGAGDIVSCNTIPHVSNRLDVTPLLRVALMERLARLALS